MTAEIDDDILECMNCGLPIRLEGQVWRHLPVGDSGRSFLYCRINPARAVSRQPRAMP